MSSSDVADVLIRRTGCPHQTYRMSSSDVEDVLIRRTGCPHQTYRMSLSDVEADDDILYV
jgi:Fe-S cluster assembly iron-binding protein IscA